MVLKTLFMFPGQGAQVVGMGQDLAQNHSEIAELYNQANDIVGYDLAKLCFQGPQEELNETKISQPAIFVSSVACLKAIKLGFVASDLADVQPDYCAGLSLGEYTALYAAGAVEFEAALKLVQLRGQSMQEAAKLRKGTMLSVLSLDEAGVEKLCQAVLAENITEDDGGPTVLAGVNFNCPGQIVLSGTVKACQRAAELAEEFGAGRVIPLSVAGGFHTEMMEPAAEKLKKALDQTTFNNPDCPVVANVDALVYDGATQIPEKLMKQLVSPVRWQHSLEFLLKQGVERLVEIGPGRVLTGLAKKTSRPLKKKVAIVTVNGIS